MYVTDSLPIRNEEKESKLNISRLSMDKMIEDFLQKHWEIEILK